MVRSVQALSAHELVRINVLDERHERHVALQLDGVANTDKVCFHRFPTNDAWCRDHDAIFVTPVHDGRIEGKALDFRFDSWGGRYPPFDLDDAIPPQMATALGVERESVDMVLEGGSIEVNGSGALPTTE